MIEALAKRSRLNGICPYFTMFPLDFPYSVLSKYGSSGEWVVDPFCGRGTTIYAARLLEMPSVGIDSSPVAAAISVAKLASTTPERIVEEASRILAEAEEPPQVPDSEFWNLAYHTDTLRALCKIREALIEDCVSDERKALRAIMLGALHGPRPKTKVSYFSNQCQRTYAPKPGYAVRYWRKHQLVPEPVDVFGIVAERARRYYSEEVEWGEGTAVHADSRRAKTFESIPKVVKWVITSPPYYGMRTYIPDQWLRLWFLGAPPEVQYSKEGQVEHGSPQAFAEELRLVWKNLESVCVDQARLVIRFGGIHDRKADPSSIIKESLRDTDWKIDTIKSAGFSSEGRRQVSHIQKTPRSAKEEFDVWATLRH